MDSQELPGGLNLPATARVGDACTVLELVVAVSDNGVIGGDNRLPWHLPADLRRFKSLTLGKHLLMGRKTYQSIGRALPGRTTLVLTRSREFAPPDCAVVPTLHAALHAARSQAVLMVVGGADVYRQCLPLASRLHVTFVHTDAAGDVFFSGWRDPPWRETFREHHAADAANPLPYSFTTWERAPGAAAVA